MQTPNQKGNNQKRGRQFRIVPPDLRRYKEGETAELRAKFTQEIYAEHAGKLQTYQGVRLWWLKKRLDLKVSSRVQEFLYKGI